MEAPPIVDKPAVRVGLCVALALWAHACGREPAQLCERLGALCQQGEVLHRFDAPHWAGASADLDGDGEPDLVTAQPGLGLAIHWRGERVREHRLYPGGVMDVALADVDGDGDDDVVFIADGALRVLENVGGRVFTETEVHELEAPPESLWVGALDGDASPDAVVATSVRGGLTIFTHGLTRRERLEFGEDLSAVEVADLEGDGQLEIVATDFSDSALYVVSVGADGLSAPVRRDTGPAPEYLNLFDFDGDGKLEAWTHGSSNREIWLHAGTGAGSFAPPQALDVLAAPNPGFGLHRDERGVPWVLAAADGRLVASELDANGRVVRRVVTGHFSEIVGAARDGELALARGARDFARYDLRSARMFTEVWQGGPRDFGWSEPLGAGDFDGDGILDVVVEIKRGIATVFAGREDGEWAQRGTLDIPRHTLWMTVGDVTGDGQLDLVLGETTPAVTVAVGQGDGTFVLGPSVPTSISAWSLHTFDAFGTGAAVVALGDPSEAEIGVELLTFDADGNVVSQSAPFPGKGAYRLVSADLEGDGREELVALARGEAGMSLEVMASEGEGWGPARSRSLADVVAMFEHDPFVNAAGLGLGDLDGDGTIDAVLVPYHAIVRLHDFRGADPPPPQIDPSPDSEAELVAVAHADDDDILDLVYQSYSGFHIALGAEDGTLHPQPEFDEFVTSAALVVDPVSLRATAVQASDRGLSVLRPAIAPALERVGVYTAAGPALSLAIGDLDADGYSDIVVREIPTEWEEGFSVLWGSEQGPVRAGAGVQGMGGRGPVSLAPLDGRPGDEILAASTYGIVVWSAADGVLERRGGTSLGIYNPVDLGAMARPGEPADIVVFGYLDPENLTLMVRPRRYLNDFSRWDEEVTLWTGARGATASGMARADFDGDGFTDVAVFPGEGQPVQIVWGNAERASQVTIVDGPTDVTGLTAGDLDGDGRPELVVVTGWEAKKIGFSGREPGAPVEVASKCRGWQVFLADLEGDGVPDILCQDLNHLSISLRAPGRADEQVWLSDVEEPWGSTQTIELDGDGILDIVAVRSGEVMMRLSRGFER